MSNIHVAGAGGNPDLLFKYIAEPATQVICRTVDVDCRRDPASVQGGKSWPIFSWGLSSTSSSTCARGCGGGERRPRAKMRLAANQQRRRAEIMPGGVIVELEIAMPQFRYVAHISKMVRRRCDPNGVIVICGRSCAEIS